jgi:hypothetical protein
LVLVLAGSPDQLISVADHTRPPELADAVDDLRRPGSHQGQITVVHDTVRGTASKVSHDRLKRREVAVDIRDHRNAHATRHDAQLLTAK